MREMKNLIKLSILVLMVFFLFVGCREEGGRSGSGAASDPDPPVTPSVIVFEITTIPESTAVPEPTTLLLFGSGLIGLWGLRKKFKK